MTVITSRLRIAAIALGLVTCTSAFAVNKYYLQLTDIPGESAARGHETWIDVLSFSWGVTSASSGGAGGGSVGKASFNDLSWTQTVDSSTPKLFIALATGRDIANAELDVAKVGGAGESEKVFFKMQFEHTRATRLQVSGGGGDALFDQAAIGSGEVVTLSYRAQKADGSFGDWVMGRFDIKSNSTQILFSGDPEVLNGLFGAGGDIAFDAGAITAVPEPASAALLLGGLGTLGALGFRRRQLRG